MKKLIRHLFSTTFLILFILFLELAVIVYLQFFMDDVFLKFGIDNVWIILTYLFVRLFIFIVSVIIFFRIVNKAEDPEFKIPWIVGMLLLPFLFSVMFLIFGNHGLRKKDKIVIEATKAAYNHHFKVTKKEVEGLKNELGNAYSTFSYINGTTYLGAHKNNRVTYYKNGETFFPAFKEGLKQAKEFIFIEFFIIDDGKEWSEVQEILIERAQAGVDVRILYDDMGCSGTISSRTPKILGKHGIKCYKFHPFRPILSGVFNNRDHRKIVIVDHQMAFTGGINLADEYANEITRFGYWKDTMVKIEGSAINNLITVFLQNHDLCIYKVSDYNEFLDYEYPKFEDEGYVMPFGDGPGGIDDALIGEQNYVNILHYAKEKVYISTPYLIPTYSLIDAMRNAAIRGVEVNLIVPGIPDKKLIYSVTKSHFRYLLDAGVKIYIYKPGFNHMKSVLADGDLAFVGTINYDFRSLVHHFECGTILYKNDCLKEIEQDFKEMIEVSERVPDNFKLRLRTRCFCSLAKLFTPLM